MLIELGKKSELLGTDLLKPLDMPTDYTQRPNAMPSLAPDHKVICGYDQGLGEKMYVCENLADIQEIYDAYAKGGALYIHWYSGPDTGFILKMTTVSKQEKSS